jgi:hypothetical protein
VLGDPDGLRPQDRRIVTRKVWALGIDPTTHGERALLEGDTLTLLGTKEPAGWEAMSSQGLRLYITDHQVRAFTRRCT